MEQWQRCAVAAPGELQQALVPLKSDAIQEIASVLSLNNIYKTLN